MTDTKQPEALRLADELEREKWHVPAVVMQASAEELRRLHAENTTLQHGYDAARLEIESLRVRSAEPAGEYLPLPVRYAYDDEGNELFSAAQMFNFVDADRAMRAQAAPAAVAGPSLYQVMVVAKAIHATTPDADDWDSLRQWEVDALRRRAEKVLAALAAPTSRAAPVAQENALTPGLIAAAEHIEGMASGYIEEHARTEPDTGAVVFDRRDAGLEYHSTLIELADDLRQIAARTKAKKGGAA